MDNETAKDILKKLTQFTKRLHEDNDFRNTVATELCEMGYVEGQNVNNDAAGEDNPELNAEQVHNAFVKAVNMSINYVVDLREDDPLLKKKLKKLLVDTLPSKIQKKQIKYYLTDKLLDPDIRSTLKSPLDFLKEGCIKSSANQTLFKKLIECQFRIKWNTDADDVEIPGHPKPFNYYEFCNEGKKIWPRTKLKSLKNRVRRTHVLVQLFQLPVADLLQELSSDDLCPPVYIRTDENMWNNWNPTNKTFGETINTGEELAAPFSWMNDSIRSYILDQAEIIPDADSGACLDEHTLYWAVIHDSDFQAGDELELNDIGQTQVYVGKADRGMNGRWLAGHCKNMMECLESIRTMREVGTYEPLLLKDVQLIEARLVLAKLKANENSALFVMKTFNHGIAEAKNAFTLAQEAYDAEEILQNKRSLDKAKKALDNAKIKAEKGLIEAESRNIQGLRIRKFTVRKESNYIIKDVNCRVRPRWQPLDMRYGMNSRK
ncbi:Hypothetical predicted protein [Paramuricea clavata]|uniref:Uncharacterized protein n=1 Tax=Paramuricea clavata TaxID=317549 RepID=A0A6S7IU40_PARCT|nr:Hypothetical predicted protein [Paramuricea clavata]